MIDYTLFYKDELNLLSPFDFGWDIFVSAYVPTERTLAVFDRTVAKQKAWVLMPEYAYAISERPAGPIFEIDAPIASENEFIEQLWEHLGSDLSGRSLCVDITGFVRPYLMYLVRFLYEHGVASFDAVYAEPSQYSGREQTTFSGEVVSDVRQIYGFEGLHVPDTSNDVLVIGCGYEDGMIGHAADNKAKAKKYQLIGFPSLRADMYQENLIQVNRAEEFLDGKGGSQDFTIFAPANDPFVVATEISRLVGSLKAKGRLSNLYLCPLSTKAHVLGFAIFYVTECIGQPVSAIFPYSDMYSKSTSRGVGRVWKYTIEF